MKKIFIISLALLFLASGAQAAASQQGTVKEAGQGNGQGDQASPQTTAGEPAQTQTQDEEAVQIKAGQTEPSTANRQKVQTQAQTQTQTQDMGEETGIMLQAQTRAKTVTELKAMIKEQKQVISAEVEQISNKTKQKVFQNQNTVREAVHALLAAEDLVGGIGKQISQIATEFNNSIEKTIEI
ncbi:hypothetical protein KAU19_00885 [Candidatus Parcubacteria bacterium]|nr:hypothetical protein [Candidatus Parcubacteria bacterium]